MATGGESVPETGRGESNPEAGRGKSVPEAGCSSGGNAAVDVGDIGGESQAEFVDALPDLHARPPCCTAEMSTNFFGVFDVESNCPHGIKDGNNRIGILKENVQPFFKDPAAFHKMWLSGKFLVSHLQAETWMERNWKSIYHSVPEYHGKRPGSNFKRKFMCALYWASTGHTVNWAHINVGNTGKVCPLYPIAAEKEPQLKKQKREQLGEASSENAGDLPYAFVPSISSQTSLQLDPRAMECFSMAGFQWYRPGKVEDLQAQVLKLREEVQRYLNKDKVLEENWTLQRRIVESGHLAENLISEVQLHLGFWSQETLQKGVVKLEGYPDILSLSGASVLLTKKDASEFLQAYDSLSGAEKAKLPPEHDDLYPGCTKALGICPTISNGTCQHRLHVHCFWKMWGRTGGCTACTRPPIDCHAFYGYFLRNAPLEMGKWYDFNDPSKKRPLTNPYTEEEIRAARVEMKWKMHAWRLIREFCQERGVTGWMKQPIPRIEKEHLHSLWRKHCGDLFVSYQHPYGLDAQIAYMSYINPDGHTTGHFERMHTGLDGETNPADARDNAQWELRAMLNEVRFRDAS